nr:MAG TPA: hypothetical protein [Caudoviricetes sp.]
MGYIIKSGKYNTYYKGIVFYLCTLFSDMVRIEKVTSWKIAKIIYNKIYVL